jgi:gluconate kinase
LTICYLAISRYVGWQAGGPASSLACPDAAAAIQRSAGSGGRSGAAWQTHLFQVGVEQRCTGTRNQRHNMSFRHPLILILFGQPGAGKSYAGGLLRDTLGFTLYEADDDLPADYRALAARGQVASEAMRDTYHRIVLERISELSARHDRLATALPLLRDRHRRWIRERFPSAAFILVESDLEIRERRLDSRQHAVSTAYARQVMTLYEPPSFPHYRVENGAVGPEAIRRQLLAIVTEVEAAAASAPGEE